MVGGGVAGAPASPIAAAAGGAGSPRWPPDAARGSRCRRWAAAARRSARSAIAFDEASSLRVAMASSRRARDAGRSGNHHLEYQPPAGIRRKPSTTACAASPPSNSGTPWRACATPTATYPAKAVHEARKSVKKSRAVLRLARPPLPKDAYRREDQLCATPAARCRARATPTYCSRRWTPWASASRGSCLRRTSPTCASAWRCNCGRREGGATRPRPPQLLESAADARRTAGRSGGRLGRRARRRRPRLCTGPQGAGRGRARARRRAPARPAQAREDLWYHQRLLSDAWPGVMEAQTDETDGLAENLGDDHDLAVLTDFLRRTGAELGTTTDLDAIAELIARYRAELYADILRIARRVYAEKPAAFRRRLEAYTWRRARRPTPPGRRRELRGRAQVRPRRRAARPRPPSGGSASSRVTWRSRATGVEVRVRRRRESCTLTVKSGPAHVRVEEEIPIDERRFEALWPLTEGRRLVKTRHLVPLDDGLEAEVDVYGEGLEGLVVAEIEFASETASAGFEPPAWLGREVDGRAGYANQSLATRGAPQGAARRCRRRRHSPFRRRGRRCTRPGRRAARRSATRDAMPWSRRRPTRSQRGDGEEQRPVAGSGCACPFLARAAAFVTANGARPRRRRPPRRSTTRRGGDTVCDPRCTACPGPAPPRRPCPAPGWGQRPTTNPAAAASQWIAPARGRGRHS